MTRGAANAVARPGPLARLWASDLAHDFRRAPAAMGASAILLLFVVAALFPAAVAPVPVFDLTRISLRNAFIPPVWIEGGTPEFLLGTDGQGRDVLSAIIYGARVSMLVGVASVLLSLAIGVPLGLIAGFHGGWMPRSCGSPTSSSPSPPSSSR
jgi:peptide/nickel transport system permease protein